MNVDGVIVTRHARVRFGQRYADLNIESVLRDAELRGDTIGGELWQSGSFGVFVPFVLRRDPRVGPVVITFLPPDAAFMPPEEATEVVEAYHRAVVENAVEPKIIVEASAIPRKRRKEPATHVVAKTTAKAVAIEWARQYGKRVQGEEIVEVSVGRCGNAKVPNTLAGWRRFAERQAAAHVTADERQLLYKRAIGSLLVAIDNGAGAEECREIARTVISDLDAFLAGAHARLDPT